MWDYRAKCLRVHDGDTLTLLIDQGLHSRQEESIRLLGVSAPELSQPGGSDTRMWVHAWVHDVDPTETLMWPLYIMTEKNTNPEPDEKRTFVRYIARVFNMKTKESLNDNVNLFLAGHPEWGPGVV